MKNPDWNTWSPRLFFWQSSSCWGPIYMRKISLSINVPSTTVFPWTWHPYPSTAVNSISLWFTRIWSEFSLSMKLVEGEVITCLTLCRYSHQCVSIFAMNRPNWCKLMQAGDQASRDGCARDSTVSVERFPRDSDRLVVLAYLLSRMITYVFGSGIERILIRPTSREFCELWVGICEVDNWF